MIHCFGMLSSSSNAAPRVELTRGDPAPPPQPLVHGLRGLPRSTRLWSNQCVLGRPSRTSAADPTWKRGTMRPPRLKLWYYGTSKLVILPVRKHCLTLLNFWPSNWRAMILCHNHITPPLHGSSGQPSTRQPNTQVSASHKMAVWSLTDVITCSKPPVVYILKNSNGSDCPKKRNLAQNASWNRYWVQSMAKITSVSHLKNKNCQQFQIGLDSLH